MQDEGSEADERVAGGSVKVGGGSQCHSSRGG